MSDVCGSSTVSKIISTFPYELIAEENDIFVASVDDEGTILHVNTYLCTALGYRRQDLIGRHMHEFIPEYDSNGLCQWNRLAQVQENHFPPTTWKIEVRNSKGEPVWIEWKTVLLKDPQTGKICSIDIGTNISDRIQAEKNLENAYFQHYRSELFNNAIANKLPFSEVCEQLATIHRTLKAPLSCLMVRPHSSFNDNRLPLKDKGDWKSEMARTILSATSEFNEVIWYDREGVALIVSFEPDQNLEQQMKVLTGRLSEAIQNQTNGIQATIGVSDIFPKPENISDPYRQALESACFGSLMSPKDSVIHWKSLGILRLLLEVSPPLGDCFIEEKLGPLLRRTENSRTELLSTLCEILTCASVTEAARRLHVHPKTISYRRETLENILSADFENPMTRADFLVALRLYQIRNSKAH